VREFLEYIQQQQSDYSEWVVLTQAEGVEPGSNLSSEDAAEVERLKTLHSSGDLEKQLREMKEKRPPTITSPATTTTSQPPPLEPALTSSQDENWQQEWLVMDREAMTPQQLQQLQLQQLGACPQQHCSFFHNWPSFRVADKLLGNSVYLFL